MKDKGAVDLWITLCHEQWLHKYGEHKHLRETTKIIVDKMWNECAGNEYERSWKCIERLQNRTERFGQDRGLGGGSSYEQEAAEVRLECALAAYKMGDLLRAVQMLKDAAQKYHTDHHCEAVTKWILGCLEWENDHIDEALYFWESCKNSFALEKTKGPNDQFRQWYAYWEIALGNVINSAIETETLAAPPPEPDSTAPITHPLQEAFLQLSPVYNEIPATPINRAKPTNLSVAGYLQTDQVFINDKAFKLYNLKSGKGNILKSPNPRKLLVMKVVGDSMNKANIYDGDSVVLRAIPAHLSDFDHSDIGVQMPIPSNGDIVAAGIVDENEENFATLKRFYLRGKKVILSPESTNPDYSEQEFDENSKDFYVWGIALAVLKPVPN